LVHTARSLCDQNSLHSELDYLRTTFRESGYSDRQIRWALNPSESVAPPPEVPASVAFLPYVSTNFNRIGRLLSRHNIKSVGLPPKKIPSFLRPVRYYLELNTPGLYSAPCECGQVYIGQTGRSIQTTIKEHQCHIRLEQPHKSAVAEHRINLGHRINFQHTTVLSTKTYMDRIIREAIEIELRPKNMKRENGLLLSRSWKPLIHTLRRRRNHRVQHRQCPLGYQDTARPLPGPFSLAGLMLSPSPFYTSLRVLLSRPTTLLHVS
jgi:hypothetical protein